MLDKLLYLSDWNFQNNIYAMTSLYTNTVDKKYK